MSLRERVGREQSKGKFFLVGGQRLDGKTTIAGTLKGKTLLVQSDLLEAGAASAEALALREGNSLDVVSFSSISDLYEILEDKEVLGYDNVYVDGISAINELVTMREDFQKAAKKNIWDAYRLVGDEMTKCMIFLKRMANENSINVGVTLAYKLRDVNGVLTLEPDVKGNVTISQIQKLVPIVLGVRKKFDEDGNMKRVLVTKSDELYPARIDSLLDENNSGEVAPELGELLSKI